MAKLTVYGASDDLVEIAGIEGADEFTTNGHWQGVIEAPNGDTAILYVDYRDNGCWTATLGRFEEDYALPQWPSTLTSNDKECKYATYLTVEVPDGTTIKELDS